MIEEIKNFSLAPHEGPYETWGIKSSLLFNGELTATKIPGYVIEKQFKCNDNYLIFTNYDCPFEESSEIVLLSCKFKILSKQSVGAAYSSFWLKDVISLSDNKFLIHFDDNLSMNLHIVRIPFFRQRPFLILTKANQPKPKEND